MRWTSRAMIGCLFVVGTACTSGSRPGPSGIDSGARSDAGSGSMDSGPTVDGGGDVDGGPSSDAGGDDGGVVDGGVDSGLADAGFDGGFDAGFDGGFDAGFDAGIDAGRPGGPVFILGAPGNDCDMTCGARGMTCGGPGTVGTDCGMHATVPNCATPGYWIYRNHPTMPPQHCRNSWGASDICNNNFNIYNSFCCLCR